MRITLVISSLSAGGAERVLTSLANAWAARDHAVTLVTLGPVLTDWFPVDPRVCRIGLDALIDSVHLGDAVRHNIRRLSRLRRAICTSNPDIVISFGDTTNVLTLLATIGLGIRVIVSERVDPRQQPLGAAWDYLRTLSYRRADALVIQTESLRQWADGVISKERVRVIPNSVRVGVAQAHYDQLQHRGDARVIAIGRLTKQKGFDLLLEAFAQCHRRYTNWTLRILGDGEERKALECQASKLNIREAVEFIGVVKDHESHLLGSQLYVLSSRYEGFPNSLLEAMAMGLAVIATDCPTGPADIVSHNDNGLLVPSGDVAALADAMERLMGNAGQRSRLAERAIEVRRRFNPDKIMACWDRLLLDPPVCQHPVRL